MRLTTAAKDVMLEALDESQASGAKFGSLHSAYSATGTNELTGGTPAYARIGATWAAASGGAKNSSAQMVFNVAAGSTVRFVGWWTAVTGGTFLGMTPNGGTVPQAFVVPVIGTEFLECVAHGFANGDTVTVWAVPGDPLPAPLVEGNVYFVVGQTTDHLQISLTSGGAAIDITAIGAGTLQKLVSELFGGQGTHTVTTYSLTLD
jgi:hypothetical protein